MNMEVTINWNVDGNTESPVLHVARPLTKAESDALKVLLRDVWNAGYDSCRVERDRQEKDPMYRLHRRNPYDGQEPCTESCCTLEG